MAPGLFAIDNERIKIGHGGPPRTDIKPGSALADLSRQRRGEEAGDLRVAVNPLVSAVNSIYSLGYREPSLWRGERRGMCCR